MINAIRKFVVYVESARKARKIVKDVKIQLIETEEKLQHANLAVRDAEDVIYTRMKDSNRKNGLYMCDDKIIQIGATKIQILGLITELKE